MTDTEPLEENRQLRCGHSHKFDRLFAREEISNHRLSTGLTNAKLDLMIVAKLDALVNNFAETSGDKKDPVGRARQRSYSHFYHNGKKLCHQFFLYVN